MNHKHARSKTGGISEEERLKPEKNLSETAEEMLESMYEAHSHRRKSGRRNRKDVW